MRMQMTEMSAIFVFTHWYCHHYAYRKIPERQLVALYDCTNGWGVPMDSIHHLGDGNSRLDTAMNRVVRNSILARCRRENFDIWGL